MQERKLFSEFMTALVNVYVSRRAVCLFKGRSVVILASSSSIRMPLSYLAAELGTYF